MANKLLTVFQNLDNAITGNWDMKNKPTPHVNSYDMSNTSYGKDVVYKAKDKEDYVKTKLELQQNAYLNSRWQKANVDLSVQAFSGLNNIKLMYRDADLMDSFPEIGAALDIVSEESCLCGDTKIKLLNGKTLTIKELYDGDYKDFWCYNVNENGNCCPTKIEGVVCNGKKRIYEITLDDNTVIRCTDNHKWLLSNNEWVETKYLKYGDSLMSIYDKLDYSGHIDYNDLKKSLYNHRVISVVETDVYEDVYDLINSSVNHSYAIKCNEGHIICHNCITNSKGQIINVYSKSERIKNVLEELFTNRLDIQITAPMIIRAMCKYGNQFMLLNIDNKNGVCGWRQLPVFNVERLENGIENPYSAQGFIYGRHNTDADMSTKFVWMDENNSQIPFRNWQIAHFRLLTNSLYLPYGVSYLNPARRHWRMLSLMEDMMLIYRLERSIERRVYKIFVGAIDDADVKAYVEDIANNFKRTPIIDPLTGQIDLRKNILPVRKDTPIPLLDGRTITIEELSKEFNEGKENYVYSIQDKTLQVVPGKVVWCGKNYTADKLIKITLDDDTYTVMASEHEVIMRDGSKKRADELVEGESIMPFYREINKNSSNFYERYEKVYNPKTGKYERTHRIVAKQLVKENEQYNTVHHSISREILENRVKDNGFNTITEYIEAIKKNHKVKSIEVIDGDDVYCMTVVGLNGEDDRHNFAIRSFNEDGSVCENGIFVSNCCDQDIFIPVRDPNAPTPIDTLAAAQNLTAMDDIKFVQNKVLTALRIPKSFLNFEDAAGDGKNLALMDVRFTRTINRIQQAFLMELTKIASIHLYILGFDDELTNFSLSMNNPSTQAEQLEIENVQKKIGAIRDAVSDPGNGIPIMSQSRALKEIMKWSDKDIQNNLEEIRLEKAIAAELEKTTQIIKKTGIFDIVDKMYGEPGAEYIEDQQQGQGEDPMGGGAMGGSGAGMPPDMGMDMGAEGEIDELGAPGAEGEGDIAGAEGEVPITDEGGADTSQPMESFKRKNPLLTEEKKIDKFFLDRFTNRNETLFERVEILDKNLLINEEFDSLIKSLDEIKK